MFIFKSIQYILHELQLSQLYNSRCSLLGYRSVIAEKKWTPMVTYQLKLGRQVASLVLLAILINMKARELGTVIKGRTNQFLFGLVVVV
jgi:hypothetical protein